MEKVGFFRREVLGLPVCAAVTRAGGDLLVQITGGCSEHIGSVSTAYFEDGERRLETLLLPHHRDDVVSERFALALSERTRGTVAVACGIHYDAPGPEGIKEIVRCTDELLEDVLAEFSSAE